MASKTFVVNQPSTVTVNVPDPVITETIVPITIPPTNKPPVANAGPDQIVKIPAGGNSVIAVLNGSSSTDPEGNIRTYQWRKVSTGSAVIQNPSSAITNVTLSSVGEHIFELRVIDVANLFSADTVRIVVTKDVVVPPTNTIPVARAGNDQTIRLPQANVTLDGSLSHDPDGNIKSYFWEQVDGPTATLNGQNTGVLQVTNLKEGVSRFRLTITDNNDATNSDEVFITVQPAIVVDPPTATTYTLNLTQNKSLTKTRHFAGWESWNRQDYAQFPEQFRDYYIRFCFTDFIKGANATVDWSRIDKEFRYAIDNKAGISIGFMLVCDADGYLARETYDGATSRYCEAWHRAMQQESVKDYVKNGMHIPNWNSNSLWTNVDNAFALLAEHINNTVYNGVRYKDALNYVDIRFYAQWGEWHNGGLFDNVSEMPAGTRPTVASYKRMIDIHCNRFPNHPLVVLFAGYDAQWLPHTMTPPEVTYYLLTKKNGWGYIGWRRDQWGEEQNYIHDYLERNNRSFADSGPFNQIIMQQWTKAPVVGEPYGPGANLAGLKQQIIDYHCTSVGNGNFPNNATQIALFKDAVEQAGAKLSLNKGTLKVSTEFDFDIALTAENFGNCPVYNDRLSLVYELRNSSGQVVWTSQSAWKPLLKQKGIYAVSDHYKVVTVPKGTYSLIGVIKDNYRALPLFNDGQNSNGEIVLHNAVKM